LRNIRITIADKSWREKKFFLDSQNYYYYYGRDDSHVLTYLLTYLLTCWTEFENVMIISHTAESGFIC